jgi:hypothetical protein
MKIEINVRYYQKQSFDEEIWKNIKGYSRYLISDHGRIKIKETEQILKPYIKRHKNKTYIHVKLSNKHGRKDFSMNDLLNAAFKKHKRVVEYKELKYNKNSEFIYDAY